MDTPFLGMVQYFAFNFAPKGYLQCSGQLMPINQYAALFSLLGVQYGGNGTTNFALPDTRGRAILGQGTNYTMGERLGTENVTLLTTNMPTHTHTAAAQIPAFNATAGANAQLPTNNFPSNVTGASEKMYGAAATSGQYLGAPTVTIGIAGGSIPFNTMNPYLALTCCIATSGLFPSRN
jgi:microcystin-dependent protein